VNRQHMALLATFMLGMLVNTITSYYFQIAQPNLQTFLLVVAGLGIVTYYLFKEGAKTA